MCVGYSSIKLRHEVENLKFESHKLPVQPLIIYIIPFLSRCNSVSLIKQRNTLRGRRIIYMIGEEDEYTHGMGDSSAMILDKTNLSLSSLKIFFSFVQSPKSSTLYSLSLSPNF